MSTVPRNIQDVLDFYAVRQPVWAANTATDLTTAASAGHTGPRQQSALL